MSEQKMKFFLDTDIHESSIVATVAVDSLPDWVEWVAVDGNGEVWGFESEPEYSDDDDMWVCEEYGEAAMLFRVALPAYVQPPLLVKNWAGLVMRVHR